MLPFVGHRHAVYCHFVFSIPVGSPRLLLGKSFQLMLTQHSSFKPKWVVVILKTIFFYSTDRSVGYDRLGDGLEIPPASQILKILDKKIVSV